MVLDKLSRSLHSAVKRITRSPYVDEKAIKNLTEDVQLALLRSDVNVELALDLARRIEKRALREEVPPGISPKEHIVRIVYEEMTDFLGGPSEIKLEKGKPEVALMVGLQGSGKTTSTAKLASYFQKRGYQAGMVCSDTYRPGAYEQLKQLGNQVGIPIFGDPDGEDAVKLAKEGAEYFKDNSMDLILIDTAGRHRDEESLMEEMGQISQELRPDEVILTIDATLGQQAQPQASAFKEVTDIGSIFITKLDGSGKGGGALSAVAATGAPIKFIGTGEKIDEIERYNPERFASRLLGMGDIETLLEKISETAKPETIEPERAKALLSGDLTLRDVYDQLEQFSKMGPLKKILQMIPGIAVSIPEDEIEIGEEKLEKFKFIMDSMTEQELDDPRIIKSSRIERISNGSGTTKEEVRELLEQYGIMRRMIKSISRGRFPRIGKIDKLFKQMSGK